MGASIPPARRAEILQEIFDRIASGESMISICRDSHLPNRITVLEWISADPELATRCARARELQAEALEEGMADVERDVLAGTVDAKAANVVLSSRRWRAEKLGPRKFGVRQAVELTGADGGPVQISDADRAARVAGLLALAAARRDSDVDDIL
jgi:hypothetical protein